ncbi:hypothetical protein L226DRAFT_156608 [Lentinus tigrinus ALCF2SS1-7]|uniref:F-box domain-containing protein n=1 Tax=Lentinus tigrinus ALCF2SS1-6 TaxID=1328759 RepID=A0A5C2S3P4_9APHY|nr:hypothetical protein L227DRAFT_197022 [Lentinus tigrinus ALCF2SS1-6]RPD72194.1 hypothetical protein L226DRAFT_156608 [Lentinus tigrinus ALCF2SS1-7]
MHACFRSPEVFSHILCFVNMQLPEEYPTWGYHLYTDFNPTLASLARTCRTFLEPTLDMLWRYQMNLGPILRTFPEDVWKEVIVAYDFENTPDYEISFARLPMASEWSRFHYYARRIKELGYCRFEFADLEKLNDEFPGEVGRRRYVEWDVVDRLCLSRRTPTLFPNLTKLRWDQCPSSFTRLIPLFFGPHLTCLSFGPEVADDEPLSLAFQLSAIADLCPNLTQLEMFSPQPDVVVEAAVEFALRCHRLESFIVTAEQSWSADFLQYLAEQPHLRKVRLRVDAEDAHNLQSLHATAHPPFSSLQSLYLVFPALSSCIELLRVMGSCRLFTLDITVEQRPLPPDLAEFSAVLRQHCSLSSLHVLQIMSPLDGGWYPGKEDFLAVEDMEPLLDFPFIRRFILKSLFVVTFDNNAISRIGLAWPLLIALVIGEYGFCTHSNITWIGLAHLLHNCPQMEVVHLSLDATSTDVGGMTSLPEYRPNKSLRYLGAQDSVLGDVELFAESLFAIAPLCHVIDGDVFECEDVGIQAPMDPIAFYGQVETVLWEMRRTRLRDQFAFLDEYVVTEADLMNDFGNPPKSFPYVRWGPQLANIRLDPRDRPPLNASSSRSAM